MAFCDWFSGFVNLDIDSIHDGWICDVTKSNVLAWKSAKPVLCPGSYDDKVYVKSCPVPFESGSRLEYDTDPLNPDPKHRIYISGNPTKFFQGHNVFGPENMVDHILEFICKVLENCGVDSVNVWRVRLNPWLVQITRLDITGMFYCADPEEWLRQASQFYQDKFNRRRKASGNTLYEGQNSKRKTVKAYAKAPEMLDHRKTFKLDDNEFNRLHQLASKLLRFEVTFRTLKLKEIGLNNLKIFTNNDLIKWFYKEVNDMNIPDNIDITTTELHNLKPAEIGAYQLWLTGDNIQDRFKKTTFYRYRNKLLPLGIDITQPPRSQSLSSTTRSVALKRVLIPAAEFSPAASEPTLWRLAA